MSIESRKSRGQPKIDFLDQKHLANPFPNYKILQDHYPVCKLNSSGLWVVSRYDDVLFCFSHPEIFSSSGFEHLLKPDWLKKECWLDNFILSQDPPEHTYNHRLVNRAFIKRKIDKQVPYMRKLIKNLISKARKRSEICFMKDFAAPFSASIILRLIGFETKQSFEELYHWARCIERLGPAEPDKASIREIEFAISRQNNNFNEVIERRRKNPRDDLISVLVEAEKDGSLFSNADIRNALTLLIAAGFHSVTNGLSRIIRYISRDHGLHQLLAKMPQLIPSFIEEMLRYDGPVHSVIRYTKKAISLSDVEIPSGEMVQLLIASANRDPRHYVNSDLFDMSRKNPKDHFAFGYGVHTCIGAALARLELKVALEEILTSFDSINCPPDSHLKWVTSVTNNSFEELPVQFR